MNQKQWNLTQWNPSKAFEEPTLTQEELNARIQVLETIEKRLVRYRDQIHLIDTNLSRFIYDRSVRNSIVTANQHLLEVAEALDGALINIGWELAGIDIELEAHPDEADTEPTVETPRADQERWRI